ncbi:MAG: TatD family hydrolase [Candidatus Paceibacterota bacterium]
MIIDTHAHVNFHAFETDRETIIKDCLDKQVFMVNVGSNLPTSQRAVALAQQYEGLWASVGLHPIHLASELQADEDEDPTDEKNFDYGAYKHLAQSLKVVAIGEMGLDYYYKPKSEAKKKVFKQVQMDLLTQELKLCKEFDKAAILHCRMAYEDMLSFFQSNPNLIPKRAVLHCFMAPQFLQEFLDLGFYIGLNGIIYKNIEGIDFREMVKAVPMDKLVLETDCPYLPPPEKKGERNTPLGVLCVAKTVAEWKDVKEGELVEIANSNAKKLFLI